VGGAYSTWKDEDFRTFLVRAEGILNRRPIAFGDDGTILTPMHILCPAAALIPGPMVGDQTKRMIMEIKQAEAFFWRRFQQWYLPTLACDRLVGPLSASQTSNQVIGSWFGDERNPIAHQWKKGRISEVYPSSHDGIVRSVLLDVRGKEYRRDVTKLSLLEGSALMGRRSPFC